MYPRCTPKPICLPTFQKTAAKVSLQAPAFSLQLKFLREASWWAAGFTEVVRNRVRTCSTQWLTNTQPACFALAQLLYSRNCITGRSRWLTPVIPASVELLNHLAHQYFRHFQYIWIYLLFYVVFSTFLIFRCSSILSCLLLDFSPHYTFFSFYFLL